ncbi:MAG: 7-cyano-7-deazaguanine synthase QueC [Endozoicomonadaceae bacterium]|nr:7-cyano-7-deazaguanine synthase QueC [Endozoicomonadaceae bacterium]
MMNKVVVIYSGGMDSYTVLHNALRKDYEVYALSFDYGQRHRKELDFAKSVSEQLGISHKVVDITSITPLLQGSSLTSNIDIPEGEYSVDNMKSTVVPNRNMILLSLATGYAISLQAGAVFYGAHHDDSAVYPDCRPEFVKAVSEVTRIADWQPVEIVAPYINASKSDILKDGLTMGLDYRQTWTCYNGRKKACGLCGACHSRLKAFEALNLIDPQEYETL